MAKVIYILGAGASAKALPVVSEFRNFIGYFLGYLKKYTNVSEEAKKYIQEIFEGIKYYPSPDTTARKLELSGEGDKLRRLNNLIGLMFFWKENVDFSNMHSDLLNIEHFSSVDKYHSMLEKLSLFIDPRYIAFFSALLESADNKILNKNLGIISWNYDCQIEKTLELLGAPIPNESQYIKLNGSAKVKLNQEILKNAKDLIRFTNQIDNLESGINYAWDNKDSARGLVQKMITDTIKVIVIGYSFPIYNRYMDSLIFSFLSSQNHEKPLIIELVGPSDSRILEYENSLRAMLDPQDWFEIDKPRVGGHLKRGFSIKRSVSPEQFPIPSDVPIFGKHPPISIPF